MTSIIQRSFAGGELSPAVYGRGDQTKYATGARRIENFLIQRYGGLTNRSGSVYLRTAVGSASDYETVLIPFVVNSATSYVLEFGHLTLRLIQNGTPVTVTPAAYAGGTTYAQGELVADGGVNYYSKQSGNVGHTPASSAAWWYPMPADGTLEIPSPYDQADLLRVQFTQSADVMKLVHPSYAPQRLSRYSATRWVLAAEAFAPEIAAPATVTVTGSAGANTYLYKVTAVLPESFNESLGTLGTGAALSAPTSAAPITVSWTAVAGALEYNVYKATNGVYGFIGTARGTAFLDINYVPSVTDTLADAATPFAATGDYPQAVTIAQQRAVYAGGTNDPERIDLSRSGAYTDFSTSSPIQDDDAIAFSMNSDRLQEVRHLIEVGGLLAFTSEAVWRIKGDADGVIKPTAINPVRQEGHGSSYVRPVLVGNTVLFVQARGSIVRDLRYELQSDGYRGNDLSVYAAHLFEGHSIVAWAFAEIPHSVVYAVRDDGIILALTRVPEHDIWGWSRLTTDGEYTHVCAVPEGDEDAVYAVVRRTINGATVRYIERMHRRRFTTIETDAYFVDCGGTYDGRNTGATTLTISLYLGTAWTLGETFTLTASVAQFTAGDVGNAYVVTIDGVAVTCTVTDYVSSTVVRVTTARDVPTSHRGVATATWSRAVDVIAGLSHLEGARVAIMADGSVVSDGTTGTAYTVTGGQVDIGTPASVVHVGLPYTAELETLDWDNPNGETPLDKSKLIQGVSLYFQDSVGGEIADGTGKSEAIFSPLPQRSTEDYDQAVQPYTGTIGRRVLSRWSENGRVIIRQRAPLPMTLLAVIPYGKIGG